MRINFPTEINETDSFELFIVLREHREKPLIEIKRFPIGLVTRQSYSLSLTVEESKRENEALTQKLPVEIMMVKLITQIQLKLTKSKVIHSNKIMKFRVSTLESITTSWQLSLIISVKIRDKNYRRCNRIHASIK